ncbi:aminopeptidase [Fulvimonas soli]|uniref:Putative aminopeptidase n=1 Tax=Fulvimonas soli TaxID=155197 RepID=A0A316IGN9_9GAMM|nr:aminopeptidase [Fulvimonas soli]PWK91950.1 putative aminopeptidase [Fulvimonas soli]TNY25151.1 aminopeptidase [Fulvimonas soli]
MGLLLSGCASLRYYAHVAHGQGELLLHRQRIDRLLRDPRTDPALARRLALALDARRFAARRLGLPDNRSYTRYVDLHRPYVVWNVFATPRHSVEAVPQCFPIAGCVAYRGYFDEALARTRAERLRAQGDDVWVGGVPAYSTLGWFADPILSSMLRWDDDELAATIFHELAHQLIYVKGDSAFNESFASFVQEQGLREWRAARGLPPPDGRAQAMDDGFTALVLDLRERLRAAYARGGGAAALDAAKQAEIAAFRARYAQWRDAHWPGDHRYDAWVAAPINNARLLPFGLYDRWMPAFAALFRRSEAQWPAFYAGVRALARQPAAAREQALRRLLDEAPRG